MGVCEDTTNKVLSERRIKTLDNLTQINENLENLENACNLIIEVLLKNDKDIPFAMIYLVDHNIESTHLQTHAARLIATTYCKVLYDQYEKPKRHRFDQPPVVYLNNYAEENYDDY
ncbi:15637_t:CDS:2, partial [Racocetra fulgida]